MNWATVFETFSADLKEAGFLALDGAGADRHGVWESTWARQCSENRAEFVTVALPDSGVSGTPAVEVWCGVEEGDRFARVLVWTLPKAIPISISAPQDLADLIRPALIAAMQMAHAIPFSEMTNRAPALARRLQS